MKQAVRWGTSRILIIDDDASTARVMLRALVRAGYERVRVVTDEREALAAFAEFEPELVLLDLRMPHVDGFTLLSRMRSGAAGGELTPVMVVSADPSAESRRRAQRLGANDYLEKPYDLGALRLRVDALLELRAHAHAGFLAVEEMQNTLSTALRERPGAERDAVARLALACSFRDGISEGHTERVGELARMLAEELRLPADAVDAIERCAPLHDIGKVGIPHEILLKPGRLTEEEMEVARRHTSIGGLILSGTDLPLLRLASEIALTHHERWDGGGYPRGLSGDSIPLAGRIVAVADVFDALTHERSYKKAWTAEAAMDEIVAHSGRQFDPEVVDALARIVDARQAEPLIAA